MSVLTVVRQLGNIGWEAHYDLPPREAVRAAYSQFVKDDWNTWDYVKYDSLVVEGHFTVSCGDYVALKSGHPPTAEEIKEYVAQEFIKAKTARDAQSD